MSPSGFVPPTLTSVLSDPFYYFQAPTFEGFAIYFSFLLWLFACTHLVPGPIAQGQPLKDGKRLTYCMNGFAINLLTIVCFWLGSQLGLYKLTIVYDHYGEITAAVLAFVVFVSFYLYVTGFMFNRTGHITKNPLIDFWLGVELNPRFGGLDLKMFALRPAMTGWMVTNISIAAKQYETYGHLKTPMILFLLFTFWYIVDYFYNEPLMLTTWDIIAENWGFMLVFGDLYFIPFAFSVQAFYLIDYDGEYGLAYTLSVSLLFTVGYLIFRLANSQKDQFKNNPNKSIWGKKPELVGGKLLVSGFWGIVRKPNYTGDLLLALSFSLPSGFHYLLPYLYPIYLTTLLIHRQMRDDKKCAQKYGEVWKEYCRKVPKVFIPWVY